MNATRADRTDRTDRKRDAANGTDWKRQALEDFRQWLEQLTEAPPAAVDQEPATCDLHDLFAELTALRQEVRLQNREQSRAGRELANAAARYDTINHVTQRRDEELGAFEQRIARAAENRCLLPVLDLRDALERGRAAAGRLRTAGRTAGKKAKRKAGRKSKLLRRLLRRLQPGIVGVAEGYELAVRRCDRMLARLGVHGVPTVGVAFDARTMHAVEARRVAGYREGMVVEEFVSGFVRDGAVLRLAEVAVNRPGRTD